MQRMVVPFLNFMTKSEIILATTWARTKHCFVCSARRS